MCPVIDCLYLFDTICFEKGKAPEDKLTSVVCFVCIFREVTIRILASDDAFGIVRFADPRTVRIQEPSAADAAGSVAQLTLVRDRGTFGDVQVPFALVDALGLRQIDDLTPIDGFATIADGESTGVSGGASRLVFAVVSTSRGRCCVT